jgi:hypothetical protein
MVTHSTILLCFLLREGETGREGERRRRKRGEALASPLKQISTLVIYKILEKTLVLQVGVNKVLKLFILFD